MLASSQTSTEDQSSKMVLELLDSLITKKA